MGKKEKAGGTNGCGAAEEDRLRAAARASFFVFRAQSHPSCYVSPRTAVWLYFKRRSNILLFTWHPFREKSKVVQIAELKPSMS